MPFDLDPSYKQVPERIADFKSKHPDGCLRPADPAQPYRVEVIGDKTFIVYTAAAFRTPDDPTPGIGVAWEPFPGRTPYTRDSELQNAETSAWGRAIVAVLASEAKSVASAEDVRNRRADEDAPPDPALLAEIMDAAHAARTLEALRKVWRRAAAAGVLIVTAPRPDGEGPASIGDYVAARKEALEAQSDPEQAEAALDAEAKDIRDLACDPETSAADLAKLQVRAAKARVLDRTVTGFAGGDFPLREVLDDRAAAKSRERAS